MTTLISPSHHNILSIRQLLLPRWGHLHRARLELKDFRLWVERVVGEQICGGFSEMPWDEHHVYHCLPDKS